MYVQYRKAVQSPPHVAGHVGDIRNLPKVVAERLLQSGHVVEKGDIRTTGVPGTPPAKKKTKKKSVKKLHSDT